MFIQTETTPNPNALKFLPNRVVSENPIHFVSKNDARGCYLANALFGLEGVESVFFGNEFVTITKNADEKWEIMKPFIISVIIDHFASDNMGALDGFQATIKEQENVNISEIEKQIIEIIETRVRPSVAMDGGDITYCGFTDGVVYLHLKGSCSGCPSASITLKNGIESMLQYYIPEVKSVEAAEE